MTRTSPGMCKNAGLPLAGPKIRFISTHVLSEGCVEKATGKSHLHVRLERSGPVRRSTLGALFLVAVRRGAL
jgi:hypothetical protein